MHPFKPGEYLLNGIVIFIAAIFLFLPSAYKGTFIDPTQTTKFVFFSLMVTISLCLAVVYMLHGKRPVAYSISLIDVFFFILLSYIILNRYLIHSQPGYSTRFFELIGLAIFYGVIRLLPVRFYTFFLLCIIAGGVLQLTEGIFQLAGFSDSHNAYFPVTGNFYNPGGYAGYLSLIAIISFWLYLNRDIESKNYSRIMAALVTYLPILSMLACIVILPALRSRSSWISVAIGLALVWITRKRKQAGPGLKFSKKQVAVTLALLFCAMYLFYQFKKNSADGRLLIYGVSMGLVKDNPVFGVGFDRFRTFFMDEQAKWFENNDHVKSDDSQLAGDTFYAFNEPLQFTVENGLTGILLIAVFVFLHIRFRSAGEYGHLENIAYCLLAFYFVFGLFTYTSDNLAIKHIIVFAIAILAKTGSKQIRKKFIFPALAICTLAGGFYLIAQIFQLNKALSTWGRAQEAYRAGLYDESNKEFESVFPRFKKSGEYLMQYGKSLTMSGDYQKALPILSASKRYLSSTVIESAIGDCQKNLGNFDAAERAYRKAMYMVPNRFYPLYLLMTLYDETEQKEKALQMARIIKAKQVKIPSIAINEIKILAANLIKKEGVE